MNSVRGQLFQTAYELLMESTLGQGSQMRVDLNFSVTRTFSPQSSWLWQMETIVSYQYRLEPTVCRVTNVFKTRHLENYWRAINWIFHTPGFCPVMRKDYPYHLCLWVMRPNILTPSAWSPLILTRKLIFSDFCSAGSSLQFVTTDPQTSYPYHKFLLQISTTVFRIFYTKGGLLATSHINFSTSSTIDIAVWRKTQGLCTVLQLASNCLVAVSAHAHIKQCSPSRQLNSWANKVASAHGP